VRRLRELFDLVLEIPEADRQRWLAKSPDVDPALRDELRALLIASPAAAVASFSEEDESAASMNGADDGLDGVSIGPASLPEGTCAGPWRLKRRLAITATAEVYESQRDRPCRTAAVKLLRAVVDDDAAARRIRVEAEALARLSHPGIVPIYDAGVETSGPASRRAYLAMELVDGERFDRWVERRRPGIAAIADLVADAAEAVHHANLRGVVHRDLKPSNLLVRADGRIAVIDFGVAKLLALNGVAIGASMQSMADSVVGTPAYMAPEQFTPGERDVDLRADVYALGAIVYEAIAGRLPIECEGLSIGRLSMAKETVRPPRLNVVAPVRVPRELADVVAMALHPDQSQRYPSCAELAVDLRRSVRLQPLLRRPPSAWRSAMLFIARRKATAAMLAVSTGLIGIAGGVAIASWSEAVHQRRILEDRAARERLFTQSILREAAKLADIGGTLEVRRDLFTRAAQHLDAIGEEISEAPARWTRNDVALVREIILTRIQLAGMLGYPAQENLGDIDSSRREIGPAIQLAEALVKQDPTDADAMRMLGVALRVRSYAYSRDPHSDSERDLLESGVVLQRACALAPDDPRGWLELAESRALAGANMFRYVDGTSAAVAADRAFDDARAAVRKAIKLGAGTAAHRAAAQAGFWELQERQRRNALSSRDALEFLCELQEQSPSDRLVGSWTLLIEAQAGRALASEGRSQEGAAMVDQALSRARALVAAEPGNQRWTRSLLKVLWESGAAHRAAALDQTAHGIERRAWHLETALRRWEECIAIVQRLAELGWSGTIEAGYLEELRTFAAEANAALAETQAAIEAEVAGPTG